MNVLKLGEGRRVSSFWKFLRVPGVVLTALVSMFLWVNKTCKELGGVQRETFKAEMCSQICALAGWGACTLKSGPGTRWTISSCQSGSSQFKGSSRQRCQVSSRTLQRPSNGCRLRSIVKICLLLSIPGRADPEFSKLFMEAFWDTFAKHGMTQYSCLPLLSSWFDY